MKHIETTIYHGGVARFGTGIWRMQPGILGRCGSRRAGNRGGL